MTLATSTRSPLTVSQSRGDHPVLVVRADGLLDATTAPVFRWQVAEALRRRRTARVLVLDVTGLRDLSPAGLRALHQVCRRAAAGRLRVLLASGGRVRRLLDLVRERLPADLYEVFGSRREAIAAAGYPRRWHRRDGGQVAAIAG